MTDRLRLIGLGLPLLSLVPLPADAASITIATCGTAPPIELPIDRQTPPAKPCPTACHAGMNECRQPKPRQRMPGRE